MIKVNDTSVEAVNPHQLTKKEILISLQGQLHDILIHKGLGHLTFTQVKNLRKDKIVSFYDCLIGTYENLGYDIVWVKKDKSKTYSWI